MQNYLMPFEAEAQAAEAAKCDAQRAAGCSSFKLPEIITRLPLACVVAMFLNRPLSHLDRHLLLHRLRKIVGGHCRRPISPNKNPASVTKGCRTQRACHVARGAVCG